MGLLDQIGGAVGGVLGQGGKGGINAILVQQLIGLLSKPGALGNLTSAFQNAGLGEVLQSWLGSGQNLPISGEQVKQVLGSGTVAELAQKAGIAEPEASNALTGLLPQVIDKLSPGGSLPSQGELGGMLSSLGKMFG